MTKDEVLKLALEALETGGWNKTTAAITAIKKALAQTERPVDCERCNRLEDALKRANGLAEHFERAWYLRGDEIERLTAQPEQEPVAWADHGVVNWIADEQFNHAALLYTTPPQREWQGLTNEEIWDTPDYEETRKMYRFAKEIEAKLKEKNT